MASSVSASSHLGVALTASGGCTITGTVVTFTSDATCKVVARQGGDGTYAAAAAKTWSVKARGKVQDIDFGGPAGPFTIGQAVELDPPSSSSGLPVALAASGGCTLSSYTVSFTAAGTCRVTATQGGDHLWAKAPSTSWSVRVVRKANEITLPPQASPRPAGTVLDLSGVSSLSDAPVTFAVSGPCSSSGDQVTLTGRGTCRIRASQAATPVWAAATVSVSVVVTTP